MPDSALCADDRAQKPVFSTAATVTKQHSLSVCVCVYMVFADAFPRKREKTEVKCGDDCNCCGSSRAKHLCVRLTPVFAPAKLNDSIK